MHIKHIDYYEISTFSRFFLHNLGIGKLKVERLNILYFKFDIVYMMWFYTKLSQMSLKYCLLAAYIDVTELDFKPTLFHYSTQGTHTHDHIP